MYQWQAASPRGPRHPHPSAGGDMYYRALNPYHQSTLQSSVVSVGTAYPLSTAQGYPYQSDTPNSSGATQSSSFISTRTSAHQRYHSPPRHDSYTHSSSYRSSSYP